jgi:hypothetical protein
MFAEVLADFEAAYEFGFSKDSIFCGQYSQAAFLALVIANWRALEAPLCRPPDATSADASAGAFRGHPATTTRPRGDQLMPTKRKPFPEIAEQHGLLQDIGDGWYGVNGLFGVERFSDGLLYAVGTGSLRSQTGVTDDVAEALLLACCPDSDEMIGLFAVGDLKGAMSESVAFVEAWDLMAEGTRQSLQALYGVCNDWRLRHGRHSGRDWHLARLVGQSLPRREAVHRRRCDSGCSAEER